MTDKEEIEILKNEISPLTFCVFTQLRIINLKLK